VLKADLKRAGSVILGGVCAGGCGKRCRYRSVVFGRAFARAVRLGLF